MKLIAKTLLLCTTMIVPLFAFAQKGENNYPSRPIHLVIPFPPGGATDIAGREVGAQLADALGQPVIIDNKPGGGAIVGANFVAKAAPDGYTLLMGSSSSLAINQSLHKTLPYDPAVDFVAVGTVGNTPGVLAVNPKVPATSLKQLIQLAKANPGKMTYASAGNGTLQHLLGELFKLKTGVNILHVPYKGSTPALTDAVGGHVDVIFDMIPSAAPLISAGKLRGLAVSTARRSELLPNLPTMGEAGIDGFDVSSWWGVVAPAGTPQRIVDRLSTELLRIAASDKTRANLLKVGAAPIGMSATEFSAFLKTEAARWAETIKLNNITLN